MDLNIDITYKQAWRSKNIALASLSGDPVASFSQLPFTHIETDNEDRFTMVFIAFGVTIRSFKEHMRPLIIIDAAHLKGIYEGTNLLAVGMDGNNQIIPIATGVSHSETGISWSWFLSKLKECIGEIPNLAIISDRHAAIKLACSTIFLNAFHGHCCRHLMMNCRLNTDNLQCLFWKMCKAYTPEEFNPHMNEMQSKRPDVYQRLIEAGVERWSRAYCTSDRYNYTTSNYAESINALTKEVRKVPITNIMEWYRELVQSWYCERRKKYKDANSNDLSDWATRKITKRKQKGITWIVVPIAIDSVYQVDDHQKIHTVELLSGTCTCRKWQLSGLPCGHVIAICRVIGLTSCNNLAKGWFKRTVLKATYQELVYPVGEVTTWQNPNYLKVVLPPQQVLDPKPRGRRKGKARIRSQNEEPVPVRCGRRGARGHTRTSCMEHIPQYQANTNATETPQQARYTEPQAQYYSHQDNYNLHISHFNSHQQQAFFYSQQAVQAQYHHHQAQFYSQQQQQRHGTTHQAHRSRHQAQQQQHAYYSSQQAYINSQEAHQSHQAYYESMPLSFEAVNLNDP